MRGIHRLSATRVQRLNKTGRYGDGLGLWLQVSKADKEQEHVTKSWVFQFVSPATGKIRQYGLGSLHVVSLAAARELAQEAGKLVRLGVDPIEKKIEDKRERLLEAANTITFKEACEKYIASQEAGWKNEKHKAQWRSTLTTHAAALSDLPVSRIDTPEVLRVLEPIWQTKPETASRLRARIERVLSWAMSHGKRKKGDNPARWKGHLSNLLAKPSGLKNVRHHPALPFDELPGFMVELRRLKSVSAKALEFLILCASRTGEVIGARWPEINLDDKIWVIPAERMKTGKEHRVPLSDAAVTLLKKLPREDESSHVFIGGRAGQPLSNMALLELMRGMKPGYVPHGFRATFKTWAGDRTAFPNHVVEQALAHTIGNAVERAYQRGTLFEKRRKLMDAWAKFATTPPVGSATNVVPLRRKRKA